jgi:putative redox protein
MTQTKSQKFTFKNNHGFDLKGRLEVPQGRARAWAVFAHCFTCSKNVAAATQISKTLAKKGIGVLRFDFTGLGNSDGDFSNTNFTSNQEDLRSAYSALEKEFEAPKLLIGHSLGGAAVLSVAHSLEQIQAVATIGAPSDVEHVSHLFSANLEQIKEHGEAEANIGGRKFQIKKQFIEDLENTKLLKTINSGEKDRKLSFLFFHSPQDAVVSIEHARVLYESVKHPKSFISLDGADHLLSDKEDGEFVASMISAWSRNLFKASDSSSESLDIEEGEVLVRSRGSGFTHEVYSGEHHWLMDEPESLGGGNLGGTPYDHLLAALGSCTSMTMIMYANRKKIPLEGVEVSLSHQKVHAKDSEDSESGQKKIDQIKRGIKLFGKDLSQEQKDKLLEISKKCPVHRTLSGKNEIQTELIEKS